MAARSAASGWSSGRRSSVRRIMEPGGEVDLPEAAGDGGAIACDRPKWKHLGGESPAPRRREGREMEQRVLGRTGLRVSVLGYGAGAVGGLMVRGTAAEQEASLARAFEAGITYVDTAAFYGMGESEKNLGRA